MKYLKLNELIKKWEKEEIKRQIYLNEGFDKASEQGYINALHNCIQDIKTLVLTNKEI